MHGRAESQGRCAFQVLAVNPFVQTGRSGLTGGLDCAYVAQVRAVQIELGERDADIIFRPDAWHDWRPVASVQELWVSLPYECGQQGLLVEARSAKRAGPMHVKCRAREQSRIPRAEKARTTCRGQKVPSCGMYVSGLRSQPAGRASECIQATQFLNQRLFWIKASSCRGSRAINARHFGLGKGSPSCVSFLDFHTSTVCPSEKERLCCSTCSRSAGAEELLV